MGYGGAVTLIVLGLIFLTHVIQFDIPGVNEQALGAILLIAGIALVVLMNTVWRSRGVAGTTYVTQAPPTERVVSEPRERVVERKVVETDVPPERL